MAIDLEARKKSALLSATGGTLCAVSAPFSHTHPYVGLGFLIAGFLLVALGLRAYIKSRNGREQ